MDDKEWDLLPTVQRRTFVKSIIVGVLGGLGVGNLGLTTAKELDDIVDTEPLRNDPLMRVDLCDHFGIKIPGQTTYVSARAFTQVSPGIYSPERPVQFPPHFSCFNLIHSLRLSYGDRSVRIFLQEPRHLHEGDVVTLKSIAVEHPATQSRLRSFSRTAIAQHLAEAGTDAKR
jgi:hypothetical protein